MSQRPGKNISRPVIGVTGNSKRHSPSWFFIRLALYLSGGRAARIKVGDDIDFDNLSGFVISGGDDINPALYGNKPQEGIRYDRQRDEMEIRCIEYALKKQIPILGICRGHQLINTVMGGTLYLSIRSKRRKTSNRWSLLPKKRVRVVTGSELSQVFGKSSMLVNSLHNQAIDIVAKNLKESAHDDDDFIQAVESLDGPVAGVQWHPEYLFFLPRQLRLFRWLVGEVRKKG